MRIIFCSVLFCLIAQAQVVEFGRDSQTLTLVYGGPTIVRFPMEVKTVSQASRFDISPADAQQPNYSVLAITPRFTRGADDVSFFLSDGSVLKARLVIVKKPIPQKTDSFYEVKAKDSEVEKIRDAPSSDERLSELDLLKAMANGRKPRGYRLSHTSSDINLGIPGVACILIETYTGSEINGYVFELTNNSGKPVRIDLTKLSLEAGTTAVLSQIDHEKLSKEGSDVNKTFLRVVTKSESLNDILPVAPPEDK